MAAIGARISSQSRMGAPCKVRLLQLISVTDSGAIDPAAIPAADLVHFTLRLTAAVRGISARLKQQDRLSGPSDPELVRATRRSRRRDTSCGGHGFSSPCLAVWGGPVVVSILRRIAFAIVGAVTFVAGYKRGTPATRSIWPPVERLSLCGRRRWPFERSQGWNWRICRLRRRRGQRRV